MTLTGTFGTFGGTFGVHSGTFGVFSVHSVFRALTAVPFLVGNLFVNLRPSAPFIKLKGANEGSKKAGAVGSKILRLAICPEPQCQGDPGPV